jgi:SAM-dependent methyltransferase
MSYRERFLYGPLLSGLHLDGLDVAELACGSGFNSLALRQRAPGVRLTGFDVSAHACAAHRANVGAPALECDLTLPIDARKTFDCAFIGGLHPCVRNLPQALTNAARMLRPGGRLLMVEPTPTTCSKVRAGGGIEPIDGISTPARSKRCTTISYSASCRAPFSWREWRSWGGPPWS